MMKKLLIPFMLLVALVISACGNQSESNGAKEPAKEEDKAPTTITYESENGPIEVPANPKRVVALANAGFVMALDVNIVGVDSWSKANKRYEPYIKDAVEVSDESLEKIIELEPDLILALPTSKNLDKLAEIAPTVTYTYGKVDYLTQHIEIGKLLNKEDEARAWVDDFKDRAKKAGEEVRAKIGEDATVSVMENYAKELYVFGDNWGRGTEILYQEMKLKMPEKVKEMALKEGYYALSAEVIPEYAGDYMILSSDGADNSFKETESYKNIPAVKNNRVFEADASEFYFNDPITLDFQLDFFIDSFKNSK